MINTSIKNSRVNSYPALLKEVQRVLLDGLRSVEQSRVRTYWETGRLIHAHILKNSRRAEYGSEVIGRLAGDLKISKAVLHRCVQFAKTYPRTPIVAGRRQFTWSHFRELITISDERARLGLEEGAKRNAWSAAELAAAARSLSLAAETKSGETAAPLLRPPGAVLVPRRGKLFTYQLVERPNLASPRESTLWLDLGFSVLRDVEPRTAAQFKPDDIVTSLSQQDGFRLRREGRVAGDLYAYMAFVEKVIDGDTLKVRLDLGFGTWIKQTLRLRGIDAPEIATPAGQRARALVLALLKETNFVVVRSSASDKYDRYLADVFFLAGEADAARVAAEGEFLNQRLLSAGLASLWRE